MANLHLGVFATPPDREPCVQPRLERYALVHVSGNDTPSPLPIALIIIALSVMSSQEATKITDKTWVNVYVQAPGLNRYIVA